MVYNKQLNCTFIDFSIILEKSIKNSIDKILSLNLINLDTFIVDITNKNIKNIIRHYIIYEICENVLKCNHNGYKIIYYNNHFKYRYINDIIEMDYNILDIFINKIINDIKKFLPFIFYSSLYTYNIFCIILDKNNTGESKQLIYEITNNINSFDSTTYNFNKIYSYTKKYGLNFLSQEYFNQLYTKKLFYHH